MTATTGQRAGSEDAASHVDGASDSHSSSRRTREVAGPPAATGSPRQQRMAAHAHQNLVPSLVAEFPDLRGDLEDSDGVLPTVMGAFALFTQAAKGRGDLSTYERCLKLADRLFAQADAELAAAIRGSYLEHLEFEGSRGPAAWRLVPPRLQGAWNQLAAENRRLMALPQGRSRENPRTEERKKRAPRRGRR